MPYKDPEMRRLYAREAKRRYRARHPEYQRHSRDQMDIRVMELSHLASSIKSSIGCACGENDPDVLDFHHRDPSQKRATILYAVHAGWSKELLLVEINKCEVLCANCHFKSHWKNPVPRKTTRPEGPFTPKAWDVKHKTKIKQWLEELKEQTGCSCGESHPGVLHFHHRDPSEKNIGISYAVARCWSKSRIEIELAKCELLCANCHRRLHANERRSKR